MSETQITVNVTEGDHAGKTLEDEGLIIRTEYQQIPPKVEYSLSKIGEKFKNVLSVLEVWGNEYIQYLNNKSNIS